MIFFGLPVNQVKQMMQVMQTLKKTKDMYKRVGHTPGLGTANGWERSCQKTRVNVPPTKKTDNNLNVKCRSSELGIEIVFLA